ncbi:MAG TPA: T9SS type A sorting domain-containing protein [Bacteroidia bacterium]|nr:T9SS type A sorting domain-containing protein [Bacteroidia bacterium]
MNIRKLILPFLFALLACPSLTKAQGTLHILYLNNFPELPADSAFEGQLYTYDIFLENQTNSIITGNLQINLKVDSITTSIGSPVLPVNMNPNDTLAITIQGYMFTQPQFKAGNNIVVVWPVVTGGTTSPPIDSLITNVFFVPLNSIQLPASDQAFQPLFPNPANEFISWDVTNGKMPERVRIFDSRGRLIDEKGALSVYSVAYLPAGVYLVELQYENRTVKQKFIKY